MTIDINSKKQIIFPGVFTRLLTVLIDLTILSVIITLPMQYISFYLFKFNFADFIIANNLTFNSVDDIKAIVVHEKFNSYLELDTLKYITYFACLLICQFIIMSFYFIFAWVKFGTTIAKYIFKIKVVDFDSGEKPTLFQAVIRYTSYVLFPISIILVAIRPNKRALHDVLAGTLVIKS